MQTVQFKTTIKCSGCVAAATPHLNDDVGADNWEVNVNDPQKLLTVTTDDQVSDDDIIKAVQAAGYTAEKVS